MNCVLTNIGNVNWTNEDIKASFDNFLKIYENRPIKNNMGGMRAPHCFSTYFLMKNLNKPQIVESGIWRGQSTWLIEQSCPNAHLICIDPNLRRLNPIYKSNKAKYSIYDWSMLNIKNSKETLCFFDDHQNAVERFKHAVKNGYKHLIFEDNYPTGQGDCISIKQTFDSDNDDCKFIRQHIKTYYEFPPIFIKENTRWGDKWSQEKYPTKDPLFTKLHDNKYKLFFDEADTYTWIVYIELQ